MITHDIKLSDKKKVNIRAFVLGLCIILITGVSLGCIFLMPSPTDAALIARIYQNGVLLETIDLSMVTESYTFQVDATGGGHNVIEVRPGSIGMTDADCPDGLCVSMGFADNSLLPIVCLPHRLIIEITKAAPVNTDAAYDTITY